MNRPLLSVFCTLLIWVSLPAALAQESGWPRTVPLEQGTLTIYPLQVDEMNDDIIQFRAALAYRETAGSEPVFGAGWFESRVEIDSSSRMVHPTDFKVTETRFPAGTGDVQSELSDVLAQQSPTWNLDFSLDELEADLQQAKAEAMSAEKLNTAPPEIIYRDHPALLVSMDGEPVLREIENSQLEAVINTPYPLIFDGKRYYLNVARGVWYRAAKATGPYQFEPSPPAEILTMVNPGEAGDDPGEPVTAANAPEIVVSTDPAELIVTEGPAAFVPLVDDLLVLQNSDDDVFMHVSSQKFYIVLAGRWYRADSLSGPWDYQPADRLPAVFADIPRGSNQADSRVYVAGTEEAKEAVLDAYVPQTAAVARGEADIDVEYDGAPVYQPVDGTDLVYIENTGSTVLQSDGLYYLVEDGVWYVSASPNGPWQVATRRPAQVDTILPTSPVHNVKYVHVYDSTPDVVYVGYTPGYTGSIIYHNTIVYGSGWYYQPWISSRYYYPRFSTWGFNVNYNPWSGWNFGLSWGWGPFSMGYYTGGYWHHSHYWHHRHYGRWGPRGYRPRHYANRGHGRYQDRGYGDRGRRQAPHQRHDNLYRDGAQRARVADTRDKQPRIIDSRDRTFAARSKNDRGRTARVSPSELRVKADVRDVSYKARRDILFADNSGKVYSKSARSAPGKKTVSRSGGPLPNNAIRLDKRPSKTTSNRPMPSKPAQAQTVKQQTVKPSARMIKATESRQGKAPAPGRVKASAPRQVKTQAPRQIKTQAPRQVKTQAPRQVKTQAPRQVKTQAPSRNVPRSDPKAPAQGKATRGKTAPNRSAPNKGALKGGKRGRN